MYTPKHFELKDLFQAQTLIREHPLAALICPDGQGSSFVSHLPMRAGGGGDAWWLEGHMARANPHLRLMGEGAEVLVVFTGPDAYISPRHYDTELAVPTWNYVAVHVHGRLRWVDEAEAKDSLLKGLIGQHDPDYIAQWNRLPEDFKAKLLGAIIGFRIEVTCWEGKAKLSQNRAATEREKIRANSSAEMQAWLDRLGL